MAKIECAISGIRGQDVHISADASGKVSDVLEALAKEVKVPAAELRIKVKGEGEPWKSDSLLSSLVEADQVALEAWHADDFTVVPEDDWAKLGAKAKVARSSNSRRRPVQGVKDEGKEPEAVGDASLVAPALSTSSAPETARFEIWGAKNETTLRHSTSKFRLSRLLSQKPEWFGEQPDVRDSATPGKYCVRMSGKSPAAIAAATSFLRSGFEVKQLAERDIAGKRKFYEQKKAEEVKARSGMLDAVGVARCMELAAADSGLMGLAQCAGRAQMRSEAVVDREEEYSAMVKRARTQEDAGSDDD